MGNAYCPKISNAFIQTRTKDIADITEHALMFFDAELLAQKPDDGFKALV